MPKDSPSICGTCQAPLMFTYKGVIRDGKAQEILIKVECPTPKCGIKYEASEK